MQIQGLADSRIASALALGLCVLSSSGCARRFKLTPDELTALDKRVENYEQRASQDPETKKEEVFVYPHRRFIVKYELSTESSVKLDRTINTVLEKQSPLVFVLRSRAGQIVEREESNGVPLVWVSFERECNTRDCAFGFVRTEDNLHKLAFVPPREGYAVQAVYRRNERPRNIMKKAKVAALGEANFVYLVKRRHRVRTVYLDVKKRIRTKEYRSIEVQEGR